MTRTALISLVLGAACTGEIRGGDRACVGEGCRGGAEPSKAGAVANANAPASPAPATSDPCVPSCAPPSAPATPERCLAQPIPSVEASPIRMLNKREYGNTVRDLLLLPPAVVASAVDQLPSGTVNLFDNHAATLTASPALVEQHTSVATLLAGSANLAALGLGCAASAGTDACAADFINKFGRRAFRRPLAPEETSLFAALFTKARSAQPPRTFEEALRLLVRAFLLSPQFLYRIEPSATPTGGIVKLGPYEIASRLSYFLWASMPDEALLAAAADGSLATPQGLDAQVRRMMSDARARSTAAVFHHYWLDLDNLPQVDKNASLFSAGSPIASFAALRPLFQKETETFADAVFWDAQSKFDRYLVSDLNTANDPKLAQFYGLPGAAPQRFGLLTQGSILAAHSNPDRTSPTRRGAYVREFLLCQAPPPPPAAVPNLPAVTGKTVRERLAQHRADPACAGCHTLIDPVGLGLEAYDTLGRFRAAENGAAVDDSGIITNVTSTTGADLGGPFKGARELSQRLGASVELRGCMARQWFRFAMGRPDGPLDTCSVDRVKRDLDATGGRVSEVLAATARSHAFLYINTERLP